MTVKEKILKDLSEGDSLAEAICTGLCINGPCTLCMLEKDCNDTFNELLSNMGHMPSSMELVQKMLKKEINP